VGFSFVPPRPPFNGLLVGLVVLFSPFGVFKLPVCWGSSRYSLLALVFVYHLRCSGRWMFSGGDALSMTSDLGASAPKSCLCKSSRFAPPREFAQPRPHNSRFLHAISRSGLSTVHHPLGCVLPEIFPCPQLKKQTAFFSSFPSLSSEAVSIRR